MFLSKLILSQPVPVACVKVDEEALRKCRPPPKYTEHSYSVRVARKPNGNKAEFKC